MKKRNKRFWSWLLTLLMVVTMSNGNAKPLPVYAAEEDGSSSVSSEVLVDGAAAATYTTLDSEWLTEYDTLYVDYAYSDSSKIGWGAGAIVNTDSWTNVINFAEGASTKEVTETVKVADLLKACEVGSADALPSLGVSTWNSAYIVSVAASTGSAERVTLRDCSTACTSAEFDASWFDTYDSVTINFSCIVSGRNGWEVGAIQMKESPWTGYVKLKLTSDNAKEVSSLTITEEELLAAVNAASREELPELTAATWNDAYIVSITGNTTAAATPAPDPSEAEALGYNLKLDTEYAGTQTFSAENDKQGYAAYFQVADSEIAVGDIYQVELTLSGAGNYQQIAVQGTHNGWDWGSGIEDDTDAFKSWNNDGIADGTSVKFRIGVTNSELTDSFQLKLYLDNMINKDALEDTADIQITSLKITKESNEAEATPAPDPSGALEFTNGMTIELDKTYSGKVARQTSAYGQLAQFYLADADANVGDVYTVTYTLSGANYNQVGFQTDADTVPSAGTYPWHNTYWSATEAMPDGNVESFTVEITKEGLAKYTGGKVSCKMTNGDVIGESDADMVTISDLKVTVKRKVVNAEARYVVAEYDKPYQEVLDLVSGEGWSNYQKGFPFPEDLVVDEVVVVFQSTGSFNGAIGTNVDGEWTSTTYEGGSGQSVWKYSDLASKNTDSSANVQVWWVSGSSTVTIKKIIFAEAGADYSSELGGGSTTSPDTNQGGSWVPWPGTDSSSTPAPTTVPSGGEDSESKGQVVKPGDKIVKDFSEYADIVDKIEVTLTSDGYFNGCLGLSIDDGWDQIQPESNGGTVTWVYDGIQGRGASGYYEIQIWYANDGVTVTLDKIVLYDRDGNVVGAAQDDTKDDDTEDDTKEDAEEPEDGTKKTQKIVREIPGEGSEKIAKTLDCNKVVDSSDEDSKMYQIPLAQFAGNGDLKKIAVTITFDQTAVQYWTGGGGSIGYSTDGDWQQVDFEHAFVDGTKNTKTFEIEIPDGIKATFDEESIIQVGWWWGSTSYITVDKVELLFEKQNSTTVEIEVSAEPVAMATEPTSFAISLKEYIADIDEVYSIVLKAAATGSFKGAVYAAVPEGELQLMSDSQMKLGDIEMDQDGYAVFTFDKLEGMLTGDLTIEITEIEEGATVVIDSITLMSVDGEEIGSVGEAPEVDGDDDVPPADGDDQDAADDNEEEEVDDGIDDEADETDDPAPVETPDDPDDGEDTDDSEKDDADLPKTGLADSSYFYFLGIALTFAGTILLKKRQEEAEV